MFRLFFISILLLSSSAFCEDEMYDPWENMNRSIFSFNEGLDQYLMQPVAETYEDVLPYPVRKGVTNFFNNIRYPQFLVSDLVQLKLVQALEHTGRFVINTTLGIGGLFDVADGFGLPHHKEDFGLALAYNGVPAGPYLVLPFLGPNNVRDTAGFLVDRLLNPLYWVGGIHEWDDDTQMAVSVGGTILEVVNERASLLESIDAARASSIDYYLFMQSSYSQVRKNHLYDGNIEKTIDEEDPFDDPF